MFVRVTSTPNSPRKSVKVVHSFREGGKVKQKLICHVGIASDESEIEKLKQLGEEFIAKDKAMKEARSPQTSIFPPLTAQEHLANSQHVENRKKERENEIEKLGRKPKVTLNDVADDDAITIAGLREECRVIEGIHEVAGHVYDDLEYNKLLDRPKDNEMLKDLVLMRLASPTSKLKAQEMLENRFRKCHDLDAIYRVMDKLFNKITDLKVITFNKTKSLLPETVDILFFDCTTLYFESTEVDDLRKFGYSKDHRFNTTQVVLALATNGDGLPIGYELFEGNKAEVKTLLECINQWRGLFKIDNVCFVADRAMMSDENLQAIENAKHTYVVAAKLRALPNKLQEQILCSENYTAHSSGESIVWIGEFDYKGRRIIASYKEGRAKRDIYQRGQVLEKIKKTLGSEGNTSKLISNAGIKKFTKSTESTSVLCEEKIAFDARWDGMHGVITNIPAPKKEEEPKEDQKLNDLEKEAQVDAQNESVQDNVIAADLVSEEKEKKQEDSDAIVPKDAIEILKTYGRLWRIEECFRINKSTLSMRPIFHFKPERIRAHVAICYMAFTVLRHMEYRVGLTQKISLETMLDELMNVQASIYIHAPTGRRFRIPGNITHNTSKIYKAFNLCRTPDVKELKA